MAFYREQQTGLFAGQGGYDVRVGGHTQLDGAVIGSTAGADKNRLETGTLGFGNLDNRAEFSVSHSGGGLSLSTAPGLMDALKTAAMTAPSALMSLGRGGNAASTTYAAVSEGALVIRNPGGQQQDVAGLSRDAAHAANGLSPLFDKEKEQQRLQLAQSVGALGGQVMEVVRTEGEIRATRAAEASGKVDRLPDNASEAAWDKYRKDLTDTAAYKAVMASYGTGSDVQRGLQAATAALQALAGGGNLQQALAGASAPYLAQLVKQATMPADERNATASDIAANAMGHALVGAVVAQVSGRDAVAGAAGAAGGELAARLLIMQALYPGRDSNTLTETEKQSVSALASVAAGLAAGIASGSVDGAATGAQAGRNAVENNYLSSTDKSRQTYLNHKENLTEQEKQERDALNRKDAQTSKELVTACMDGSASACSAARQDALEKQATYQNLGYQNPKETQDGYQQIQQLLVSTGEEAKQTRELFNGMVAAYMRTGMSEEAAKSAVGYQMGAMYIAGGLAGVGAGKAAEEGLTPGVKPSASSEKPGAGSTQTEGKPSSGAENAATYPKLKEDLVQQNLDNIAKQDPRLAAVVQGDNGKLNYGVGSGTKAEADRLGQIWVGDGAKLVTNQKDCPGCLISADGLRIYRPPSEKPNAPEHLNPTGIQANFVQQKDGKITGNAHMSIEK
ncbi:VENN motif pre-toxin domain-containing protein [Dickeya sp. CSL RW240]|uniref:VENN motif pre-toxin domain-containing protein n=3 Tax=unclassified Dickeya TaxID=2622466 RepID=UPI000B07C67E|nr:VENN motif pre-toxin domain-containing protein [Dickeya sp. CSL RW240]